MLKKSNLLTLVRYSKLPYYEILSGKETKVNQEPEAAVYNANSKKITNQNVSLSKLFGEKC